MNVHNRAVTAFPTDKARALLVYLALAGSQPQRRERLADLLWPTMQQTQALTNLRLTLHRLRQTFEQAEPLGAAPLIITRQTVQINPDVVAVDALRFQQLLADCGNHKHADLATCEFCRMRLTEASLLYDGELLAGFGLSDAPTFEEWLLLKRESVHQQVLGAFSTLVWLHEQRHEWNEAHGFASRQLALDPSREGAHRQLIRILARRGLTEEALAQFDRCRQHLQQQLGVEPDAETMALVAQIRSNDGWRTTTTEASPLPVIQQPQQDWGDAPQVDRLYGRKSELAQVASWLMPQQSRVVVLLGIGGVGKTTLAAAAARAVMARFDHVIWRSLLNAPPLDELIENWLRRLTPQNPISLPTGLDGQLQLLFAELGRQRCLLILDNWESILQPDQPGQVRPAYSGYAQLLGWFTEREHASCLLITSRERPQGLARREEDTPLVRTLLVEGLTDEAGRALLIARGLVGGEAKVTALIQHYSGNPLALKLVAQAVQELFDGQIDDFLHEQAPIFDDIYTVLHEQFARLSATEQSLLIWLAIEREPISSQQLRQNWVHGESTRLFIEALRALQRRSLVSQSTQGLQLQNVVIEFLTDLLVTRITEEISNFATEDDHKPDLADLWFNGYALLKATAKEYLRNAQQRLILAPVAERLRARLGRARLVSQLQRVLRMLRMQPQPGYATGNLLNLLLSLEVDLQGYDFSGLEVRQAYLQGKLLPEVNFAASHFRQSLFTHLFGETVAMQFTNDGHLLIAGVLEDRLSFWLAADGELVGEYHAFGAGASIANFSPDGTLIASGHVDTQIRVWDVRIDGDNPQPGTLVRVFAGHAETPWALAFSADNRLLASSGADGVICLWDLASGELRQTLIGHQAAVPALAFSPDGSLVASGDVDGMVLLWRVGSSTPYQQLSGHKAEVHILQFDPNGRLLATGSHDRTVRLWQLATGQLQHLLQGHRDVIRTLIFSRDGRTLASGGGDRFVGVWDVASGTLQRALADLPNRTHFLAFHPQGDLLAISSSDQTVSLWSSQTGQQLTSLQAYCNILESLAFCPSSPVLAVAGGDAIVRIWHPQTGTVKPCVGHTGSIGSVAFAHQRLRGQQLLASAGSDRTIRLWDAETGHTVRVLQGHHNDIEAIAFNPRAPQLVSASRDHTLRLWDLQSGQTSAVLTEHSDRVHTCAFSPDGCLIASGGIDRLICIWQANADGHYQLQRRLYGHTNAVRAVVFSPDNRWLASSSFDQTVRLWSTEHGETELALPIPHTIINAIAFHPTDTLLVTGAKDNTLRFWATASGELLFTVRVDGYGVQSISFSDDGAWFASANRSGSAQVWETKNLLAGDFAPCYHFLPAGPYAKLNIQAATGLSPAQKAALLALGAIQ